MKKQLFITLFTLCSFALVPAQAGTIDLLSVWAADKNKKPGGVDENAGNTQFGDGVIDQGFASSCVTCAVTTGSIADITSSAFWSTGTAQDHSADMANMLAFEGVVIPGLAGIKDPSSFTGKKLMTTADFTGYLTVKASTFVWLFQVNDDGVLGNQLEVEIGTALDGKEHDISHFTQWAVTEVPVPAAAWLFITGLLGLAGLRRSVKS
ncbi:MAG: VPLPA-CTERM sorting domain-containing protein [Porticoccaceae bacterium]